MDVTVNMMRQQHRLAKSAKNGGVVSNSRGYAPLTVDMKIDLKVNLCCNFRMDKISSLFNDILLRAKSVGLNQKELASRAGIRQETLSRAKKRGTVDALTLEKLVKAVGADFSVVSVAASASAETFVQTTPIGLKDPKWMLAWSNPEIGNEVLIRKALLTARFATILQACLDFGVAPVAEQWSVLTREPELSARALPGLVNDILTNIKQGFAHAQG